MFKAEAVSVRYGHIHAVRDVSLVIEPGEIVSLLGPNGAGKSSLLRTFAGLQSPSSGQIWWNDQRLDLLTAHQIAHTGIALVPEGRKLFSTMTVQDNLMLGGYTHHAGHLKDLWGPVGRLLKSASVQERLTNVYRLFPRLQERRRQMAANLSGGEQQMLAIGRALMASPQLLLLDEPSIGLAPNLAREIFRLLDQLRSEGLTILLVEQDAHAALRIADRGYILETGHIVAEGAARELLASQHMRHAYLGAP
jgi:branched-chain amino acid transport system ATP-binding protein